MQKNTTAENLINTNEKFGLRLAVLREQRHISARQMSLDMGQNKNYISSIESGNNYPTMGNFFDICAYLNISPQQFFEDKNPSPFIDRDFTELMEQLPPETKEHLYCLMLDLLKNAQTFCF